MPAAVGEEVASDPGPSGDPASAAVTGGVPPDPVTAGPTTPLPTAAVLDITAAAPGSATGTAAPTGRAPSAAPATTTPDPGPPAPDPAMALGVATPPVTPPPVTAPPGPPADPAPAAAPPPTDRPKGRRHSRTHSRRRGVWWIAGTVVLVALVATAAVVGAGRINRPLAQPTLAAGVPASFVAAGAQPDLPWPTTGQGAVALPSLGYAAQSGAEPSVPVASLTKLTTALVILRDHPVAAGTSGPSIPMTAADVAEYEYEEANDESNIPLRLGEVLTERQMLEALLVRSANDVAYSLALWDAGSLPAFVAKMNATAAALGAASSHYVDASGYEPGSVSTAADCLRVAAADMAIPTFAEIVDMTSVDLPLVGTEPNIVSEIGTDGIIGVKSGYTSQAKAGLVLAANRTIDGRPVLVLAAVLTQPVPAAIVPPTTTTTTTPASAHAPPTPTTTTTTIPADDLEVPDVFRYATPVAESLLGAAQSAVVQVTVATAGQTAGVVTAHWGGHSYPAKVVATRGAWVAAWPGQRVSAVAKLAPVPPGSRSGRPVGRAIFALGDQIEAVPLQLATTVQEPSWWWRLVHG